jgi:plastocyanin
MSSRRYLAALVSAVLIAAFAMTPLASKSTETAAAAEITVNIRDFNFNPANLTVQVGDVVRWENNGGVPHTTSSTTGIWDSGPLAPGGVFSQQFTTAGTFQYACRIHPSMQGTIVVQGGAPTATAVPAASVTPVPSATPAPTSVTPAPATATAIPVAPTPTPSTAAGPPTNVPELWLLVLSPTPAYTMNGTVNWVAQPGEWYRVFDQQGAWALTVWELDTPYNAVWIQADDRVAISAY